MKTVILTITLLAPLAVFAHGGGLNAQGCHIKTNIEHCHSKGPNQLQLNAAGQEDREKLATHKLQCRGTPGLKNSQPTYDLSGKRCKPSEAAP
jgi:hypothetical protein